MAVEQEHLEAPAESGASSGDGAHADRRIPDVSTDYWVTVCSACRTASCWHGESMCGWGRTASTIEILASVLRIEGREHRDNFSVSKLEAVCGSVRYVP